MAYTPEEIAAHKAKICEQLAEGKSLRAICSSNDSPAKSLVFEWLASDRAFADQYARAREAQADAIFDEILDIADTPIEGEKIKIDKDGNQEVTRGDMIEHRRLQVDARKWMAGKLAPKKYGDKLDVNHGGQIALTPTLIFEGAPDGNKS